MVNVKQPSGLMASKLKGEMQTTILGMKIEAVDGLDENEITTVETLIKERNELRLQVDELKHCRENVLKRAQQAERKLFEARLKNAKIETECNNYEALSNRIEFLAKWGEARAEACIKAQEEIAQLKNEIRHKKAAETDDEEIRSVVFYPLRMFSPKPYFTCIFRIREQGDYFFGHTLPDGSVKAAVGNAGSVSVKDTSNLYFAQIEECEEKED